MNRTVVAVVAIVAIALVESAALLTGQDGLAFAGSLAAIGSVVGAAYGVRLAMPEGPAPVEPRHSPRRAR